MKTTVLLDFSVLCHQMHRLLENMQLEPKHYQGVLKAQMQWVMSGEYLGDLKPDHMDTLLCIDSKPYWRVEYLKRPEVVVRVPRRAKADQKEVLELKELLLIPGELTDDQLARKAELTSHLVIHYKAGRKFPKYSFTKLKKDLLSIVRSQGWPMLAYPGYEADDMAASFSMLNGLEECPDNVILVTVDTDWLGLLDQRTTWFCSHGWNPRVRTIETGFSQWCDLKGYSIDKPEELWYYKAEYGDSADNLPKGSPLEVIHLLEPPLEYTAWLENDVIDQYNSYLTRPRQDITAAGAVQYLQRLGVPLAIKPYQYMLVVA